jgi:hypothetical protein
MSDVRELTQTAVNDSATSASSDTAVTQPRSLTVHGRTLSGLIKAYQTDPTSTYHGLRYHVRKNHESMLRRLSEQHGHTPLSDIRARTIKLWHMGWSEGGKLSVAQAFLSQLSTMCGFGLTMLEDPECERIALVLNKLKRGFAKPTPKKAQVTADYATAFRSMALAQAIQFELGVRQKDVVGEWVPFKEPGDSEIRFRGQKWLRGIRWEEVGTDMVLTHTTSKKQKPLKADLTIAPMIVEELAFMGGRKATGPIIINEITGAPWSAAEFRRKWRIVADAAGIPKSVKSMHSRHGAASEAFKAKVNKDDIRHSLTHSDVSQTEEYNCSDMDLEIRSEVMKARVAHRVSASKGAM